MKQFKLGPVDQYYSPAVGYLVAPLINGDTLSIIAGELSRATGGHLDPDQLGGEGGGAGVVHHAGEVKHVGAQQQRGLQRLAGWRLVS